MKCILISLLLLSACTSKTEFGPCIGAFDDKDPAKVYELSDWNVFMGVVFVEAIIPPILVVKNETLCPVGNR